MKTFTQGTQVYLKEETRAGTATVLGPGDKDFDQYGVVDFDYILKFNDLDDTDMFNIRRVFSDEIEVVK